jgi:hypothetical protein
MPGAIYTNLQRHTGGGSWRTPAEQFKATQQGATGQASRARRLSSGSFRAIRPGPVIGTNGVNGRLS